MMASTRTRAAAPSRRLWLRAGLLCLTSAFATVGLWATLAPRSFYSSFPGAGHDWVALLPPYNEHLVRDVGALNLGFAVLLAWAAATLNRQVTQAALVVCTVSALPHFAFHLSHLDGVNTADAVGQMVTLGLMVVLPLALLASVSRAET